MGLVRFVQNRATHLTYLVVGLALVGGSPAVAQQQGRLVAEARALFKAVDRGASGRCKLDRSWDSRPVVAETAKRYLKLLVHADFVVSEPPATPMQVIDPAGRESEAFCASEDRNAVWQAAVTALRAGDNNVLRLTSISYGFPVFNVDYTRAALVVQQFSEAYNRTADGTLRRSIEAAGGAEIYARRGQGWRRIDYDSYYAAH